MSVQSTYTKFPPSGLEGSVVDRAGLEVITKIASAATSPGRFVCFDDGEDAKVPAESADVTNDGAYGFVQRNTAREDEQYAEGEALPIVKKGRLLIKSKSAFAPDGPVFVIFDGADAGLVRNDDGDTGGGAIAAARPDLSFRSAGEADDLAIVEADL